MTKIKEFFNKYWTLLLLAFCIGLSIYSISQAVYDNYMWFASCLGWCMAGLLAAALFKEQSWTEYKVLLGKKEIVDSYSDLIEKTKLSVEYFSGYREEMLENVSVYSQMASCGVEAPVANSIVSFAQEIGPDHTIILVGINHRDAQWSVRVAGKSIHLSQLKAIWSLVNDHLEKNAKPKGTLIIKQSSVPN